MDEGSFAQVSCIVNKGDQPLSISWSFHGSNITSDLGIVTTPIGQQGSMLVIPSVGHKHRGSYTCKVSNQAGVRSETVQLRVNGSYRPRGVQKGTYNFKPFFLFIPIIIPPRTTRTSSTAIWSGCDGRGLICPSFLHREQGGPPDQPLSISWAFHGSNITSDLGIMTMPTGPRGSQWRKS